MFKKENYNPLMFLSALGAGGLSITFFMYLMFMIPRDIKENPIPTFNSLFSVFSNLETSIYFKGLIIFSIIGIIFFAFKHIQLVIWNLTRYFKFKKTKDYKELKKGNGEVMLMTLPLTLAMSVNIMFILGAVFIPNLWSIVEYLFPISLLLFVAIGYLALNIFGQYSIRLITQKGGGSFIKNNNLAQLISVFAFAMIGVGFAASSAMSQNEITSFLGLIGSIFFITIATLVGILKLIIGFIAILRYGLDEVTSPSIWIVIPFLTLLGIIIIRNMHGLENFGGEITSASLIIVVTIIISIQIVFGFLGYKIMKQNNYFKNYIYGKEKNPGTYSLICPGVALVVFAFFFLHLGLVSSGIILQFGIIYFILLFLIIYLQFKTIYVFLKLNKKFKI